MVVLITRERLTRRSPWPGSVIAIPIVIRRNVRIWRSSSPSFATQPPSQTVNLKLHGFGILLMRRVTSVSRLVGACLGGMNTSLTVSPLFKVEDGILTLGPPRLCLVWPWTHHSWKLNSLKPQNFPQIVPIIRTKLTGFKSLAQKVNGLRPKKPKTMNFVKSGLEHWTKMSWITNKVGFND